MVEWICEAFRWKVKAVNHGSGAGSGQLTALFPWKLRQQP